MKRLLNLMALPVFLLVVALTMFKQMVNPFFEVFPSLSENTLVLSFYVLICIIPAFFGPMKKIYKLTMVLLSIYFFWAGPISEIKKITLISLLLSIGWITIFKEMQTRTNKKASDKNKEARRDAIRSFYRSPEWRKLRLEVLREANYTCSECGIKEGEQRRDGSVAKMHGDHKLPRSKYPELALKKENIDCLCDKCNIKKSDRASEEEVELYRSSLA